MRPNALTWCGLLVLAVAALSVGAGAQKPGQAVGQAGSPVREEVQP
jgi:hypothetical protein